MIASHIALPRHLEYKCPDLEGIGLPASIRLYESALKNFKFYTWPSNLPHGSPCPEHDLQKVLASDLALERLPQSVCMTGDYVQGAPQCQAMKLKWYLILKTPIAPRQDQQIQNVNGSTKPPLRATQSWSDASGAYTSRSIHKLNRTSSIRHDANR